MADNFKKLLDQIPTDILLREAKERNASLRKKHGRFAAQMVLRPCKYCKKEFGARRMREHVRECPANPNAVEQARKAG